MDIIHNILKTIDHNRWTAIGLSLGLVVTILFSTSCAKETSPISGRTVSANELDAEVEGYIAEQQAAQASAAKSFAAALQSVQRVAEQQIADITVQYEQDADARHAAAVSMNAKVNAAFQSIAEQQGFWDNLKTMFATLLKDTVGDAAPGLQTGLTFLSLLTAGGVAVDNRRKDKIITKQSAALGGAGDTN